MRSKVDYAVAVGLCLTEGNISALELEREGKKSVVPFVRGEPVSFEVVGEPQFSRSVDLCAICDGSRCLKGTPDCLVPHVLYVASFGRILKVGVTRLERFERRIIEQGAEFAARVGVYPDGMSARRAEKDLATSKHIRLNVRFEEKVREMSTVRSAAEASRLAEKAGVGKVAMIDFRDRYQDPDLWRLGRAIILGEDKVKGSVADTRGETLFVGYRGNLYAYDLRRTIGRRVEFRGVALRRQLTMTEFSGE